MKTNTEIKNIFHYLYRKYTKLKLFFNRLVTLPLHIGSFDYYPPVNYKNDGLPLLRKTSFSDSRRIEFWTKVAKAYPSFEPFYELEKAESYLDSLNMEIADKYRNEFLRLYKNGCMQINNFFNKKDYDEINEEFNLCLQDKLDDKATFISSPIRNKKVIETIHRNIKEIEKVIFAKEIKKQIYNIQGVSIKNGVSPYKTSTIWHQDRFIPCFKIFYFPEKVTTNPLEYLIRSNIIDGQYLDNAAVSASGLIEDVSKKHNYAGYDNKSFYVDGNTLLVVATHGFHRRLSENKEGQRKFITINYYKEFTRYDLLFNYIKKKIFK